MSKCTRPHHGLELRSDHPLLSLRSTHRNSTDCMRSGPWREASCPSAGRESIRMTIRSERRVSLPNTLLDRIVVAHSTISLVAPVIEALSACPIMSTTKSISTSRGTHKQRGRGAGTVWPGKTSDFLCAIDRGPDVGFHGSNAPIPMESAPSLGPDRSSKRLWLWRMLRTAPRLTPLYPEIASKSHPCATNGKGSSGFI